MYIPSKGSPSAPCWVIVDTPMSGDVDKGYLFSSSTGYVFDKMMQEAGIPNYYVTCYRPDTEHDDAYANIPGDLNLYKPPIIIPLGAIGHKLLPVMSPRRRKKNFNPDKDSELSKYAGSLMQSEQLNYPHYVIPTYHPVDIIRQWKLRDIIISCDLGKAAAELDFHKANNYALNPLPIRNPKIDFDSFDELIWLLNSWNGLPYISNDIETIYPRAPTKTQPSQFYKILPGYPVTIGLAPSKDFGISFDLFRESKSETRELWRVLYKLLKDTPSIGQNFFNFDANFYECLGFTLPLELCRDTMILHHLLWAELPHKLQFLARQYTREPYWKDEGAGWSPKNMRGMKIYNCKDVMVTYEIFEEEMKELKERGLE